MKIYRSEKSGRAIRETCDRMLSAWGGRVSFGKRTGLNTEHGLYRVSIKGKR